MWARHPYARCNDWKKQHCCNVSVTNNGVVKNGLVCSINVLLLQGLGWLPYYPLLHLAKTQSPGRCYRY